MNTPLPVITQPPPGPTGRAQFALRSRRWAIALVVAIVESLYFVFNRPGMFLGSILALAILAGSVMLINRVGPGLLAEILVIVAIAQGMVLLVPVLLGFSIALAFMAAAGLVLLAVLIILGRRL